MQMNEPHINKTRSVSGWCDKVGKTAPRQHSKPGSVCYSSNRRKARSTFLPGLMFYEWWKLGQPVLRFWREATLCASKSSHRMLHIAHFLSGMTILIRSDFIEDHRFIAKSVAPYGGQAKWCYSIYVTKATICSVWISLRWGFLKERGNVVNI